MILGMTYYQICWYFILYSFVGWCIEVIFHALKLGKVINRGFLNGPVCPVYGFGMLGVLAAVNGLDEAFGGLHLAGSTDNSTWVDLLVLFLLGIVLATLVELIAGWALDKIFHTRWWDYSEFPFNFHGYICLKFSILWGIGAVIVVKVFHPIIGAQSVTTIPTKYGWWILLVLYMIYLVDLILTVMTMIGLNKQLTIIDDAAGIIHGASDVLTEGIAGTSMKAQATMQETQLQMALGRAELGDALEEYAAERAEISAARKVEREEASAQRRAEWDAAVTEWNENNAARRAERAEASAARKAEWSEAVDAAKADFNEVLNDTKGAAVASMSGVKDKMSATRDMAAASVSNMKEATASAAQGVKEATVSAAQGAANAASGVRQATSQRMQDAREQLATSYSKLTGGFLTRRLISAFPEMHHHEHDAALTELKSRIANRSIKKKGVDTVNENDEKDM